MAGGRGGIRYTRMLEVHMGQPVEVQLLSSALMIQIAILALLALIAALLAAIVTLLTWFWLNIFKKGLGLKIEIKTKEPTKPA